MKDQPLSSCTFSNLTPKNRRFHRKGSLKNIGKGLYMGECKQRCVAYVRDLGSPNWEVPQRVSFTTVAYVRRIVKDHWNHQQW